MRSLPVAALPEVEADLRAAAAHYASWRADGAEHVLRMYEETVAWIAWNPEAFPRKLGAVRRAILKRSYYVVYFLMERDRSLILAVLDGRQSPDELLAKLARRQRRRRPRPTA